MGAFVAARGLQRAGDPVAAAHGPSCSMAYGILVPQAGIKPISPVLQGEFLITGPPGKICYNIFNDLLLITKGKVKSKVTWTFSQFSSVAQSCPTICDSMNRSTPGLPVHHQLPGFTQTYVH